MNTNQTPTLHNLGYPRIGDKRELKFALEAYWAGKSTQAELQAIAKQIRQQNWQTQIDAGITLLPINDFALYDQVLNTSTLLGVIPQRFKSESYDLETAFRIARGRAPSDEASCCAGHGHEHAQTSKADYASSMKKWFGTNYHYIVPEIEADTEFKLTDTRLFDEVAEAQALISDNQTVQVKPVLIGPLTYLYLSENKGFKGDILSLLPKILPVYQQILQKLAQQNVQWVQIDEPILGLELSNEWQKAFKPTYDALDHQGVKVLLATYFESLGEHTNWICDLAVDGIHLDGLRGQASLDTLVNLWPADKVLSLGLIDGRNIWVTDLQKSLEIAQSAFEKFGANLWLAPSCSLLHVPVNLEVEEHLNPELKSYLAFAKQKLTELSQLKAIISQDKNAQAWLNLNKSLIEQRKSSKIIHNPEVKAKLSALDRLNLDRNSPFKIREALQKEAFDLPLFPTTTIGSFPQTPEIRQTRRDFKKGLISEADYTQKMQHEIQICIDKQEAIGLDVFVHGEPERNDMVEYFGEQLDGYAFTQFGWVQSYGSRCVKPPIIFGDVARPNAMTVSWSQFAQSRTQKIMKGMITGPVTMLQWSFVRDDQPRETTCKQIALALRNEVLDLEAAGITMIQIDEAALREGLPLKKSDWAAYLTWAVDAFRVTASGVKDSTQIHTHMCYSEFNDIIDAIAKMDADVITIETSKSHMKLLQAFVDFEYPNEIGPGVYDIHSPNIPTVEQMVALIEKASQNIPKERLWVNPDCGLKTRGWQETEPALTNMVKAAKQLRASFN